MVAKIKKGREYSRFGDGCCHLQHTSSLLHAPRAGAWAVTHNPKHNDAWNAFPGAASYRKRYDLKGSMWKTHDRTGHRFVNPKLNGSWTSWPLTFRKQHSKTKNRNVKMLHAFIIFVKIPTVLTSTRYRCDAEWSYTIISLCRHHRTPLHSMLCDSSKWHLCADLSDILTHKRMSWTEILQSVSELKQYRTTLNVLY